MNDESRKPIRRLTIEEVEAAMAKTGLTLARRVTFDLRRNCGCPIWIVAKSEGRAKFFSAIHVADLHGTAMAMGLDTLYAGGLMLGFDECGSHQGENGSHPSFLAGYADGRAIAAALLPTGSEVGR